MYLLAETFLLAMYACSSSSVSKKKVKNNRKMVPASQMGKTPKELDKLQVNAIFLI